MRWNVRALVALTAVIGTVATLSSCAATSDAEVAGPHSDSQRATQATNATQVASCVEERVRPFNCNVFTVQYPSGAPSSFQAWFDLTSGRPRLLVGESEHLRVLPVRLDREGATAAPIDGWKPLQRTCFPNSECALDRLVERVFTGGPRITVKGGVLRVQVGSTTMLAKDTGRVHRYAQVGTATAGGRTLLTYRDNGVHMAAANGGQLSVNKAGCLTDGSFVLVLPDTTTLNKDGSINIAGRHVPLGGTLQLGGGEGPVPANQQCGTDGYWYGYGD